MLIADFLVGYQFFMSEGIMAMYNKNLFTNSIKSREIKTRVHWILQAIGGCFVVFGISMQIYNKQIKEQSHFHSAHSITGKLRNILMNNVFM